MLAALIRLAVERHRIVIAFAAVALAWGVWSASHAPLDVLPSFAPPQVVVQTECPGLAAEQVELLVTRPLESALLGSPGLDSLRSQSIQGLSIVTATFEEHTDPYRGRQLLSEQLVQAESRLPDGVRAPRLTPLVSSTMDLLKIGLVSDALTPRELRGFAQWTLRPRMLAVAGVAGVSVFGGEIERIEVRVLPERLEALGLTLRDVADAARRATAVRGAGFVEGPNQRLVVEPHGQFETPAELAAIVLDVRGGRSVLLGDVAEVVTGSAPLFGDAVIQGRPGVLLTMLSQYGANTLDVTRAVEAALDEMRPVIAARGIVLHDRLHRPANFIENALGNLEHALLLGAALVALVLLAFLFDLRTAFISLTAIPLSLCAAVAVLQAAGATLNTITLGGLAIALGEVVDDAIVDVENILRRLRENARSDAPRSVASVVLSASLEVRGAVVFATLVVVLVFVPVLTLSGLQGRLFAPLGAAYVLAVLASLGVALTVTPALAIVLLPAVARRRAEPRHLDALRELHGRVVTRIARHPFVASLAALLVLGGALALLPGLGREFLPEFREGHFVLHASTTPGTSLPEMRRIGEQLSKELLALPEVATVEQQIGRAELGEDPWGPNRSELHLELKSADAESAVRGEEHVRATLAAFPGIATDVLTFLGDRIEETISGETAEVVVEVFGEDLDALDVGAAEVARVLAGTPGSVDVLAGSLAHQPSWSVDLDSAALARAGIRPADLLDEIQIACQGVDVAQIWRGDRVVDVTVTLAPDARDDPEKLARLRARTPAGPTVTLASLAHLYQDEGRAILSHEGGRRRQVVTCNVSGRDLASFVDDARTRLAGERVVPIAMTATVTALGLLPLALRGPGPGSEIEAPMAAVILGGLISSTLLNLLLLPVLALRFGRFDAPRPA